MSSDMMLALGCGLVIGAGLTIIYLAWRLDDYERRLMRRWQLDLASRQEEEVIAEYGDLTMIPESVVVFAQTETENGVSEGECSDSPSHLRLVEEYETP